MSLPARSWFAMLVACSPTPPVPPTPPATARGGNPTVFARVSHPLVLVQGRDRLAFDGIGEQKTWFTFDATGRHDDPALAASLAEHALAIGHGEAIGVHWGRTPLVATAHPQPPAVARPGSAPAIVAPDHVFDVVAFGDDEVWRFSHDNRIAVVDAHDVIALRPVAQRLGALACGNQVDGIAASPSGVEALIVECDPSAEVRVLEVFGARSERRFRPIAPIEPVGLLVAKDASPIVVGTRAGALAIAHGARDGTWRVVPSAVPAESILGAVLARDGAVWTLSVGIDPRGKDSYHLARDGSPVLLRAPDGAAFSPRDLGVDAQLGVTVLGKAGETTWLAAEHPPAGISELP